ncbi:hypothetical protein [Sphingomonas sp. PAMC 26617]|uniref:hypothetical protein n=1 Tax=Sphingomonas sp. PAMC 26617 TaxID=1112216 RepID=UPI000494FA58|nr:hypothetical protein [Sphingomonas sp. PAMC 26617]
MDGVIRAAGMFSFCGFVALCEKKGLITQRRKDAKSLRFAAAVLRAGYGFVELRSGKPAKGYQTFFSFLLASLRLCVIKSFLLKPLPTVPA